MSNIPLPTRAPSSAEIEAARQLLERIYQAPSASSALAGNAAAQQAGGLLIKGASTALLTAGIWVSMQEPAGLPVLQEHLIIHGPRGFFDQMERMLQEKDGDTQAVRALRTTVMGMLDNGQVHSAGLLLGETLAEAQRGGLISRHADPTDLGISAALRYSQQHPPQPVAQAPSAGVPAAPAPLAESLNTTAQPPALTRELQSLRDRINSGQYANSSDAYDQGAQAFNSLVEQVNALRRAGTPTVDNRSLQIAQDELAGRRTNSILSQYLRNAENGGPLPGSADMDRYMGQVRQFNETTRERYGRPMFDPAALDRIEQRLDRTIDFREDMRGFLDRATSGQYANSAQRYEQGTSELEQLRIRSNALAGEGLRGMNQQDYDRSLLQLEGRRINSVMSYVGDQLQQGQPIDPQITQSLVDRAQNLNARSRAGGNGDFFDAGTLDTYGDRNATARFRQDYREFNAQVLSGQFANSDESYRQGQARLQTLVDGANRVLTERGVQPLPQGTLDETGFQLEGRRINSQLSHLQREVEQGRSIDPERTRALLEQAESLNTRRSEAGRGDFFDAQTMRDYRELQRGAPQASAPPTVEPAPGATPPGTTPQTPPATTPTPAPETPAPQTPAPQPQTPGSNDPDAPPANRPEAPQRDIEREWQEEFGGGELSEQLRREAERQGVSQEDVVDHARRNPSKTANEILADVRDGQLGHGGTPPGNRPPGSSVAAPGEPDDTPPLDNLTIVRPRPEALPEAPQPLRVGEARYDIVGVNDGERPSLEVVTHNGVPRYVPAEALVPRTQGEPHPDARARQVELVTTDAQGREVSREAYDITGVRRDGLMVSRQGDNGAEQRFVPYGDPNERVEFAFPNGSRYIARQTVDGSVRFDPAQSERTTIALQPGMEFEARLRGRETESPYRIRVGEDFGLTAQSTDPARANAPAERIAVSDIAPTWQRVTSTTAPGAELYVDSAQYRRAAQRVGRDGEPDYPIGTLSGESVVRHGFANQLYRPVLDALRDPATTGDVSIAMYGIGTSREGRQYTDALLEYARRNPDAQVTIHSGDVQIDGRRGEALREWLSEHHPNIRITEPLPPSNFNVPHEKIVAIGDRVFVGSEKIGVSMSRKVGFMAEMGAEEAQLVHGYIQGLGDARTDPAQTRRTLETLAERGVLIDDPRAGFYPNTAAMNRVLNEAQEHLRIYQSDLTDTAATQRIIDRARDGVQIDLRYREIDPQSLRMLQDAAAELPNLRAQRVPNDPLHPIYQHENYVISERGGVLSSAYMWEPKAGQVPRYTNGGEGGVLLDAAQARQYERYLDTAPTRQIGPGAILDLGEEAWNKLAPRLLEYVDRLRPQQERAPTETVPSPSPSPSPLQPRSSVDPESPGVASAPTVPVLDPRATALLADSRSALDDMNRRVGVNPPAQVTETLAPQVAQQAYAAGFNEVARTDLNTTVHRSDGSVLPAGTQIIASSRNDERVVVDIAAALRKTPEQAQADLAASAAQNARTLAQTPSPSAPEREQAPALRMG